MEREGTALEGLETRHAALPGGMTRRKLIGSTLTGAVGTVGAAGIAGCAVGGDAAGSGVPTPAATPVTLDLWTRFTFLEGATTLYNQGAGAQRKITLSYLAVPANTMTDKLTAAIAGGTTPDITTIDCILNPSFNALGGFTDLTDRFNGLKYKADLSAALLKLGNYKSKQYQLPLAVDNSALYWNTERFSQAGLASDKAPETWDEFREFARKLTQPPDRFGAYLLPISGFTFLPWVWANGGEFLNEDGTKCLFAMPETVEALDFWAELNFRARVTPDANRSAEAYNANQQFYAGTHAMMMGGNANIPSFKKERPDLRYSTALIPTPKKGGKSASYAGGDNIGIPRAARQPDRAWEALQFFLEQEVQVDYFAAQGVVPVRREFYDNKYMRDEPRLRTFTKALDVAKAPWSVRFTDIRAADGSWMTNMRAALLGQKPARQAAEEIQRDVNVILSK